MTPEDKKLWVDALRSGKYKQCDGKLATKSGDGEFRYCCLGVACEVFGLQKVEDKANDCIYYETTSTIAELPESLQDRLQLSPEGNLEYSIENDYGEYYSLVELNDDADYTFEQIADIIEEQF